MKTVGIYTRISRDREGAGLGVDRQEQDCRELVERNGWTVGKVYQDNDLSAYSGKPRPGYRALLEDIRAEMISVVVAWHTDRLHRSPVELEDYIAACDPRRVPTHTVKAGPLDLATPSGRMVARQLGAVARYEVEHSIERQQAAKAQAAAQGRWKGGRRPYGYDEDGMTVRPCEAEVVDFMADQILNGGSIRSLVANLNDRGLVTSTGKPWRHDAVRNVLLRPRNAGLMEHRGQVVGEANWPAILDQDRWRAVVAALRAPGRRTQWSSARVWLLSGIARCGLCGEVVRVHKAGHDNRPTAVNYACKRKLHLVRVASGVDDFVTEMTLARLASGQLSAPDRGDRSEVVIAQRELVEIRERLDALGSAFGAGTVDARQLESGTRALRQRQAQAEAIMARSASGTALAGVVGAEDIRAAWEDLTLDRRRAIVDTLMTITLLPARKGRPPGWRPGQPYFDPATVAIEWRTE